MKHILIAAAIACSVSAQAAEPVSRVASVVSVPVVKKPKLLRSHPFRFVAIRLANAAPSDLPDDEDLAVDRRRELRVDCDDQLDLDDQTKLKLAQARLRALDLHRQIWG